MVFLLLCDATAGMSFVNSYHIDRAAATWLHVADENHHTTASGRLLQDGGRFARTNQPSTSCKVAQSPPRAPSSVHRWGEWNTSPESIDCLGIKVPLVCSPGPHWTMPHSQQTGGQHLHPDSLATAHPDHLGLRAPLPPATSSTAITSTIGWIGLSTANFSRSATRTGHFQAHCMTEWQKQHTPLQLDTPGAQTKARALVHGLGILAQHIATPVKIIVQLWTTTKEAHGFQDLLAESPLSTRPRSFHST